MVSAPACQLVGTGFNSRPGHPGGPFAEKSDEEKRSGLRTLVHIQCGVTMKYCKSPKKSLLKKNVLKFIND